MKVFVCLVTPEEKLRRHFGRSKEGIIPAEALKRGPLADLQPQVTVAAWKPEGAFSARDLERFLLHRARSHDACILIVDTEWGHYTSDIRNAAYSVSFEAVAAGDNPQNFFFGVFARLLRNFGQIIAKFRRGDDSKLLTLPLRNFQAEELVEIAELCRIDPLSATLSNDIETRLARLRTRVRPRRKTSFIKHYAVDDAVRFFEFGPERHAQFATGTPHLPYCEMAGLFRFGVRLDERRHYNVSETEEDRTKIEGDFRDCHSVQHAVKNTTHLNMFANDYF